MSTAPRPAPSSGWWALMLEQNDEWAVTRRYMSLEGLAAISRIPVVSLPAITA